MNVALSFSGSGSSESNSGQTKIKHATETFVWRQCLKNNMKYLNCKNHGATKAEVAFIHEPFWKRDSIHVTSAHKHDLVFIVARSVNFVAFLNLPPSFRRILTVFTTDIGHAQQTGIRYGRFRSLFWQSFGWDRLLGSAGWATIRGNCCWLISGCSQFIAILIRRHLLTSFRAFLLQYCRFLSQVLKKKKKIRFSEGGKRKHKTFIIFKKRWVA